MGDAGADTPPRQPASQGSKLHASAPTWPFCLKMAPITVQSAETEKITHCNVALIRENDLFWCAQPVVHINWLNLERFPL
ncbi:MAG TPA: hypothetical protein DIW86_23075 [Pseudomonas sp.]|nr:hypothetical protein [Pseudomonas sp.]